MKAADPARLRHCACEGDRPVSLRLRLERRGTALRKERTRHEAREDNEEPNARRKSR